MTEAKSSGILKKFFIGLDPQKTQREIDQTSIMIDSQKRLAKEITDRIYSLNNLHTTKEKETGRAKADADNLLSRLAYLAQLKNKNIDKSTSLLFHGGKVCTTFSMIFGLFGRGSLSR